MSRVLAALAVIVLGLGLVTGCSGTSAGPPTAPSFTVYPVADRKPAPALTGDLLAGGKVDPATFAGRVVVVNFWASWCGPCVLEAPDFEQVFTATKGDGVSFLGVNTRDTHDAAAAFVVGRMSYPSVFDPAGSVMLGFAVPPASIPSTIIIDRQGRVAASTFGYVLKDTLQPLVTQLARESG